MNNISEYKKIRRTGILPGCLAGGILAALVPVLELAVRWNGMRTFQGLRFRSCLRRVGR